MKTAGVVVTYNRKEELVKNIRAILSQSYVVDRYYIIDNHSSDNTEQLLKEEGILDNQVIKYVYLKENIGGSGGFYTGLKMAYEDGYDFICLMDDDGRPADKNMMEILVKRAEELYSTNKLLLLNSLVCGSDDILSFGLNGGIKTKQIAAEIITRNSKKIGFLLIFLYYFITTSFPYNYICFMVLLILFFCENDTGEYLVR